MESLIAASLGMFEIPSRLRSLAAEVYSLDDRRQTGESTGPLLRRGASAAIVFLEPCFAVWAAFAAACRMDEPGIALTATALQTAFLTVVAGLVIVNFLVRPWRMRGLRALR